MEVVLFNEISLNGRDMHMRNRETYLAINDMIPCDGILMDATTAFNNLENIDFEAEREKHKEKKAYDKELPYLIIPDTKGILNGYLHMYRKRDEIRDLLLLITKDTPKAYIEYLNEREYSYIVLSQEELEVYRALEFLEKEYHINKLRLEGSNRYHKSLINKGLVKEMYLLIDPVVSRGKVTGIEEELPRLKLLEAKVLNDEMILTHYLIN